MKTVIEFNKLATTDLIKGAIYKGGVVNNLSSEPISKLLPVGNQSGIRFSGKIENPNVVVLYSTFKNPDWPDSIEDDLVTYYLSDNFDMSWDSAIFDYAVTKYVDPKDVINLTPSDTIALINYKVDYSDLF